MCEEGKYFACSWPSAGATGISKIVNSFCFLVSTLMRDGGVETRARIEFKVLIVKQQVSSRQESFIWALQSKY